MLKSRHTQPLFLQMLFLAPETSFLMPLYESAIAYFSKFPIDGHFLIPTTRAITVLKCMSISDSSDMHCHIPL